MAEERRCSKCGGELSAHAPQGLCPQRLIELGLPSDAEADKPSPWEAAELAGGETVYVATEYLLGKNDDRKVTDNWRLQCRLMVVK